jgi:RNA-binding protein YlmH
MKGKTPAKKEPDPGQDKLLLARAQDRYRACQQEFLRTFTDFMDPIRAEKFLCLFHGARAFGGWPEAERKLLGFAPEGLELEDTHFPITCLSLRYSQRFNAPPGHRDYLGAVLGLGLDRGKVGDICLGEGGALVYVRAEVADYIQANLAEVGRAPITLVTVATVAPMAPGAPQAPGQGLRVTVASLRLDGVVSAGFRLSRGKAAALVEGEKVSVNWVTVRNGAKLLAEGDVLTVRGLGRIKIRQVIGETKKGRLAVEIEKF